jgi:hypothetical protein
MRRIGVAAVFGLAAASWAVPEAHGQSPFFQVRPNLTLQQAAFNIQTLGRALSSVPPYALGFNPYATGFSPYLGPYGAGVGPGPIVNPYAALATNPFGGAATLATNPYGGYSPGLDGGASLYNNPYGGYYPYSYENPLGSYLRGGADVINAQGRFMVSRQQANLLREQVRSERIQNRRRIFDEYLYEREKTPTVEQLREEERVRERDRSRNNPPLTEIYSAKALNDLLVDLQRLQNTGVLTTARGPQVPLDEDLLRRVNITSTKSGGNLGLLKNEGRLSWPAALSGAEFRQEQDRLNRLAQEAVSQASTNLRVDPGTLQQMSNDVDRLQGQLSKSVRELTPAQYIEARQFLNSFEDALKALRQPDVGNHFTGKYAAKAKSVGELVEHMTKNGLQFAPATAGDQSAYLALHRALAAYDYAVQSQVAERK